MPKYIKRWDSESGQWETMPVPVDSPNTTDQNTKFDFQKMYTRIEPFRLLESKLGDDRITTTEFFVEGDHVVIRQSFDADPSQPTEMQREASQTILDNFARHVQK